MIEITKVLAGVALTAFVTVTGANAFESSRKSNTLTISGDRGGHVIHYALQAKRLERSGRQVRFAGRCDSACTLYLGMPRSQTCITPDATFGFHLPYGASAKNIRVAQNYMIRSYPGWVRRWISARGGLSNSIKTMTYSYARQYLPSCADARIS